MKLTKICGLLVCCLAFSNVYASDVPDRCPSVGSLASTGIDRVFKWPFGENEWMAVKDEVSYDTDFKWYFNLSTVTAKSPEAAIAIAPQYIKCLHLVRGPELDDNDSYSCVYQGKYHNQEISGLAIHVTV